MYTRIVLRVCILVPFMLIEVYIYLDLYIYLHQISSDFYMFIV